MLTETVTKEHYSVTKKKRFKGLLKCFILSMVFVLAMCMVLSAKLSRNSPLSSFHPTQMVRALGPSLGPISLIDNIS